MTSVNQYVVHLWMYRAASNGPSPTRVTGKREEVVTFDYGINELEQPTVHS